MGTRRVGARLVAQAAVCAAAWLAPAVPTEEPPAAQRVALLVGVNTYDHFPDAGLDFAEGDVEALAAVLRQRRLGFSTVRVLTTAAAKRSADRPSGANIRQALAATLRGRGRGDTVLLAFGGHGIALRVGRHDRSFFCPSDGDTARRDSLIDLHRVYADLADCAAGARLMLVDACRNRPRGSAPGGIAIEKLPPTPPGTAVLFACAPGEFSFESKRHRHGLFSQVVLEALGATAPGGTDLTWNDLALAVRRGVPPLARSFGVQQHPHELTNQIGEPVVLISARAPAPPAPPALARRLSNSLGMELRLVPRGRFPLGSPATEEMREENERYRQGEFSDPFYVGATEVTQGQYLRVMGVNPAHFTAAGAASADQPVERVSWDDAVAFCQRLSNQPAERQAGRLYRLPTEAEWEYACRAGTTTAFHTGATLPSTRANYDGSLPYGDTPVGPSLRRTSKVGSFATPNAWGLHDAHGNVWEWCADLVPDLPGGPYRAMRGGSWRSLAAGCRSANRGRWKQAERSEEIGFRVLCTSRR